jgi:hypothetical protein
MRIYILLALLLFLNYANGQDNFPKSWEGEWKGELNWYKTGSNEPEKIKMQLRIRPTDSAHIWSWQIKYRSGRDNRPYYLIRKDSLGIHWVIDEGNSIVLDQFWVGNRLNGAFTVMGNTIFNSYWMENDKLMVEFFSIGAKPIATTGKINEDIPGVDSYRVGSYQKAVLKRE